MRLRALDAPRRGSYPESMRATVFAGVVLLSLAPPVAAPAAEQEQSLVDFEIEDQFGREYRASDYGDRVLVILASDREGSRYNPIWGRAIQDAVREEPGFERLAMLGLADLGGVPRLIRGMVRRAFPKERERAVLLDWQGVIDEAYGLESGHSNILLFAPGGRLIYRAAGRDLDEALLEQITSALRSELAAPDESAE